MRPPVSTLETLRRTLRPDVKGPVRAIKHDRLVRRTVERDCRIVPRRRDRIFSASAGTGRRMNIRTTIWRRLTCVALATLVSGTALSPLAVEAQSAKKQPSDLPEVNYQPGVLPAKCFSGGSRCATFTADFQIHQYNENFYILRESGCVHAEKPFLYLLFGNDKAILFDTGAGNNTDPTTGRVP